MYLQPNKCNVVVIVGLTFLLDLFDVLCTLVEYIAYNNFLKNLWKLSLGKCQQTWEHLTTVQHWNSNSMTSIIITSKIYLGIYS